MGERVPRKMGQVIPLDFTRQREIKKPTDPEAQAGAEVVDFPESPPAPEDISVADMKKAYEARSRENRRYRCHDLLLEIAGCLRKQDIIQREQEDRPKGFFSRLINRRAVVSQRAAELETEDLLTLEAAIAAFKKELASYQDISPLYGNPAEIDRLAREELEKLIRGG